MSTALPGYDRWKTTNPADHGDWCATCGGRMHVTRDPDTWPFATHSGEATCCALCDAWWEARNETDPRRVMQAVAEIMALDDGRATGAPRLRVKLNGGGREYEGQVVDWCVDGRQLTIDRGDGREADVRLGDVREVVVLDA